MKALKRKPHLKQYLLDRTAYRNPFKSFDDYSKEELIKVFKEEIRKDFEFLKQL